MPEHYSLTMEVAKDRTTKATAETCSSEKFNRDECPRHVSVGQEFIVRSLNEPCHKMVSRVQLSQTPDINLLTLVAYLDLPHTHTYPVACLDIHSIHVSL